MTATPHELVIRGAATKPSLSYEEYNSRAWKRLASAVLMQAIKDLRCPQPACKAQTRLWFEDPESGGVTFAMCCGLLERQPENVRRRVFKAHASKGFEVILPR